MGITFLKSAHQVVDAAMNATITSAPVDIKLGDNVGVQFQWTGTPTGTFTLQSSIDYTDNQIGAQNAVNAGNWTTITVTPSITQPTGAAGLVLANLNQLPFPWVRLVYTPTGAGVFTVAVRADEGGDLAGLYVLMSDGTLGHTYAFWFSPGGGGSAPVIPGVTAVEVDIVLGDDAAAVGTALAAAVAAVNSTNSFTTSGTSTVTVTLKTAGPWTLPSTSISGFTITETAGVGVLNAYVSYKGI